MKIWRQNSWSEIHGAPTWFLDYLAVHLSVEVEPDTKAGDRFGIMYEREGVHYGSLLSGSRVPAGLTEHVVALAGYYSAQGYAVPCEVIDTRKRPDSGYPLFVIGGLDPRKYQDQVHSLIMREGVGVIDAPPRSGKTFMAASALDRFNVPTVYLAPSVAIVRQTYERFSEWFGSELVSRIDGSATPQQKDPSKLFVIATPQSAVKLPREWWDSRDCLVIDEFHHAASETYHRINSLAENVYHRLCFTGTHWRTGSDGLAMEAICSRVLYKIDPMYLVRNGFLAKPFISFVPTDGPQLRARNWQAAYEQGIAKCDWRNSLVAQFANSLVEQGEQTIVLVKRREQADVLSEMIPGSLAVKGGEASLTDETLKDFLSGSVRCVVGTTVLGEGVDLPSASSLIYASGGTGSVQMLQSYFRPLTAHPGKEWGRIYDFDDSHHPTLSRHSESRKTLARHSLPGCVHE